VRFHVWILLALALGGCSDRPLAGTAVASDNDAEACWFVPRAQTWDTSIPAGTSNITPPGAYSSGGSYHDFDWSSDRSDLVWINVSLTWDDAFPGAERMRAELHLSHEQRSDVLAEGPSPLMLSYHLKPDEAKVLRVVFGMPGGGPTTLGNVALVDQDMLVAFQETYWCGA
jgi:hypothetical protein